MGARNRDRSPGGSNVWPSARGAGTQGGEAGQLARVAKVHCLSICTPSPPSDHLSPHALLNQVRAWTTRKEAVLLQGHSNQPPAVHCHVHVCLVGCRRRHWYLSGALYIHVKRLFCGERWQPSTSVHDCGRIGSARHVRWSNAGCVGQLNLTPHAHHLTALDRLWMFALRPWRLLR